MSNHNPILEMVNITKRYDAVNGMDSPLVLDQVNLSLMACDSVAIIGPSGFGKSTLLNLIGALDRPTAGQVIIDGTDLGTQDEPSLAWLRNQQIGFVFQTHHLLPQCTAWENVLLPTLVPGCRSMMPDRVDTAKRLLARVGLVDHIQHRPSQLSVGQCQRVAVVRALVNQPRLLLADEPTGALDQDAADSLTELLVELNYEEKVTLVVATHSSELAARMARVLELKNHTLTMIHH